MNTSQKIEILLHRITDDDAFGKTDFKRFKRLTEIANTDVMASSTVTMATFASTMYKCNRMFNLGFKTETADFRMAKWDISCQPGITIPATIVNDLIIKAHDRYGNIVAAIDTLLPQECQIISEECLWLYDLNQDMGPKNIESLRKLELLLDTLVEEFGVDETQSKSLSRFRTVALCYLHWAMVTQGVYHPNGRVIWSRGKSRRHWAPILAPRKPVQKKRASTEVKYKGPSHSKENVIPKLKAKVDDIIEKMETIIRKEDYAFDKVQINEEFNFSREINEYLMTTGKFYLGANGAKKLNKLYQELQKARTQLSKATYTAHSDIQSQLILDDGTCVKFKQERKEEVAEEIGERVRLFSRDVMPVIGATEDKTALQEEEEDVPDNWEDVEF